MIIKPPEILDNVLSDSDFVLLKNHAVTLDQTPGTVDMGFGRKTFGGTEVLQKIHEALLPKAKEFFQSESLKPSFSMIAIYEGEQAALHKHKDDNACTYHFDVCIFHGTPWDIWVSHNEESKAYSLYPNQALAMYGNDQDHWREKFPNEDMNRVCNAFFFFCEPDHWYFTEGPDYLHTIRAGYGKE
jgi:hypothetical protein